MSELVKREHFPRGVPYILWNIFFDRFSSGGFIVILAIYLNQKLNFDTNTATALYHINECFLYFFTIVGAMIADSYWGIYKTLINMSFLCACSATVVSIASLELSFIPIREISFIGLAGAMIGMGCVKSNQNVFGGNQFKLPEQANQLDYYFSMHYLVLKCGQVGGMVLMPILREDVKCFGKNDCYPLAFSVIAILMTLSVCIMWIGRKSFVHVPPAGDNIVIKVLRCIKYALKIKMLSISENKIKKSHWLDYSEEKFGSKLVRDTKAVLSILVMYIPLPIFWALLSQQSSRWVFQAARMNGDIGFYTLKPDQMIVLGPLLIMILIPTFNQFIFPLIAKIGVKSALQKMSLGMIFAALSFVVSAYIETQINAHEVSILWLFPQYLLMSISEVLLWVANVAFAYTQAPTSMKSVMTASVYMSVAGGSLIVFLISGFKVFSSLVHEFIFYACLMFIDTIIFGFLAMKYKYIDNEAIENSHENA